MPDPEQDEGEGAAEPDGEAQRHGAQDGDGRHRRRDAQGARRQGAQPLQGVPAVLLPVAQVVDQVDGARRAAEGDEGQDGAQGHLRIEQQPAEDERREDEDVLGPLGGPQGIQERSNHGRIVWERACTTRPAGWGLA